ncbi:uncharacterized protein LOC133711864 [Rosa rugosa]|uniref:uncharacterized protein LOC133711864 n=1 Tax=Rosa rugosa TaxID=74645 RepID=UPI002B40F77C|nr:uncharacterized protein LOC133711864 [Rosa rugosa]
MIASNGNKKVEIIFDQEHWVPNTEYSNKKFTTAIGIDRGSKSSSEYIINLTIFIKDKCEKNSTSRKRQRSTHRGGAMPFIQHALRTAKEGNPLSFIDNWAAMYQDSNSNWVSDAARDKYDRLKNKREEHKEKLTLEAPEGTPPESVQVTARDEIPIMAEECGRKGKRVRGLGSFPPMELPTVTSSIAVSSEMNVMQDKVKKLESTVDTMRSQNTQLMTMLKKFLMNNSQGCFADTENINMNIVVPNSEEDDVFGRDEDGVQNNGDNSETEDLEKDL